MSQPDNPDPSAPKSADAVSTEPATGEAERAPAPESPATSAEAAAAPDAAPAAEASSEGEGEGEGDADGDAEGDAEDGDATAAAGEGGDQAAAGAPKKKRRRRRKKKPAGEGAAAEGEAATGEGGEGAAEGQPGARPARPKKERVERERPAFNVGDVVFGKVLEVTEDALFVDLSGKAKALFDLRELLITEEEAEEYNRAHTQDRREAQAAGEPDDAQPTQAVAESGTVDALAPTDPSPRPDAVVSEAVPSTESTPPAEASAETAPETAPEASETAPEAVPVAAGPDVSASGSDAEASAASSEAAPAAEPGGEDKAPQLPRVILEPGAPFVGLVHNDGGRGGLVVLTHHPKRVSKAKPVAAEASRSGALVFGLVTGTIKGGVEVDVDGLRAFAPASHVELRPGADLSHLVGKRLPFAVTQYGKRGRDVVLSRRALLESEYKEKREEALKNIQIGAVVDGVVRTVVAFGAFVDVGGVEGLVPLSEMSHNRSDGPRDVFKVNEPTRVKILRVDEKGKLWLSRKAAIDDPWSQVAQKYAQGTRHTGKIVRLQPFGAFVELESGIDGLIHAIDLSVKRIEHPEEVVKVGDEIEVVVANVDSKQHRIALHPAPTGEAANEEPQRIAAGRSVKVVVVTIESGGLTVRVLGATGRQARGFISAAATGTPRGTELRKLFPVGKELEAKIVELDPRRGELKLSIKALNEQTERDAYQNYRAQVKREAKFGTFADLLAKRNVTPEK